MKVLNLPLSKNLGILKSKLSEYLLFMPFHEGVLNHIQTIHASASYALAEITAGQFLKINFPSVENSCIPILRGSKVKYRMAVTTDLYSSAELVNSTVEELLHELEDQKKALFKIHVKLFTPEKELAFVGDFEWFVTMT